MSSPEERRAERDRRYLRDTEKARLAHDQHLAEIDSWLASLDEITDDVAGERP